MAEPPASAFRDKVDPYFRDKVFDRVRVPLTRFHDSDEIKMRKRLYHDIYRDPLKWVQDHLKVRNPPWGGKMGMKQHEIVGLMKVEVFEQNFWPARDAKLHVKEKFRAGKGVLIPLTRLSQVPFTLRDDGPYSHAPPVVDVKFNIQYISTLIADVDEEKLKDKYNLEIKKTDSNGVPNEKGKRNIRHIQLQMDMLKDRNVCGQTPCKDFDEYETLRRAFWPGGVPGAATYGNTELQYRRRAVAERRPQPSVNELIEYLQEQSKIHGEQRSKTQSQELNRGSADDVQAQAALSEEVGEEEKAVHEAEEQDGDAEFAHEQSRDHGGEPLGQDTQEPKEQERALLDDVQEQVGDEEEEEEQEDDDGAHAREQLAIREATERRRRRRDDVLERMAGKFDAPEEAAQEAEEGSEVENGPGPNSEADREEYSDDEYSDDEDWEL